MPYTRPTVTTSSFARVQNNVCTIYTVAADLHNRRITTTVGPIGRKGRVTINTFATRDEARDFLDVVLERRENLGYEQVA